MERKRLLLLRFCFPELPIFHACKKSAVSRTTLSTASLPWAQFRFKRVSFYCCRSVSKTPLCNVLVPAFCGDKQEIRSVKDKPFYCQSSVGTIPFQGRVFLLLPFCKQNASLQQLLSQLLIPGPSLIRFPLAICEQRLCAASAQSGSWGHTLRGLALQLLVCRQRACACYHLQARPLVGCPGKNNPHVEPLCR